MLFLFGFVHSSKHSGTTENNHNMPSNTGNIQLLSYEYKTLKKIISQLYKLFIHSEVNTVDHIKLGCAQQL